MRRPGPREGSDVRQRPRHAHALGAFARGAGRAPRPRPRNVPELAQGEWIERQQNLLITGPTGVGKTWLACALGQRARRDNRSVLYQRVPRMLEGLGLARGDGRYARMLKSLARVQVLILDD